MTEVEWCRQNAPDEVKYLSDEELTKFMADSYAKFCSEQEDVMVDPKHTVSMELEESRDYSIFSTATTLQTINYIIDKILRDVCADIRADIVLHGNYICSVHSQEKSRVTSELRIGLSPKDRFPVIEPRLYKLCDYLKEKNIVSDYTTTSWLYIDDHETVALFNNTGIQILTITIDGWSAPYGLCKKNIGGVDYRVFSPERAAAEAVIGTLETYPLGMKYLDDLLVLSSLSLNISKAIRFIRLMVDNFEILKKLPKDPIFPVYIHKDYSRLNTHVASKNSREAIISGVYPILQQIVKEVSKEWEN